MVAVGADMMVDPGWWTTGLTTWTCYMDYLKLAIILLSNEVSGYLDVPGPGSERING